MVLASPDLFLKPPTHFCLPPEDSYPARTAPDTPATARLRRGRKMTTLQPTKQQPAAGAVSGGQEKNESHDGKDKTKFTQFGWGNHNSDSSAAEGTVALEVD